ncbi:hypothetical protein MgSA37_00554 [Mucilaginibacter gotjawali]|uniref:Uncharacterized protein n=2 Tax=Mucilaginibacter gotjawali TaxID=1550579 RepID=A0A110B0W3_9SPHI|nr:hypothetical protein [Mucilaginibacter gotjawali]BAU52397.1 hypothetical protein MgSA37_00554 [Mucilaginibacter gotjawali]
MNTAFFPYAKTIEPAMQTLQGIYVISCVILRKIKSKNPG